VSKTKNIKKEICAIIDEQSSLVLDVVKDVGSHPELGYKEFRTSDVVNDFLRFAGFDTERGLAITGIKTSLKKEFSGPNIAFIGELDGITCPESSRADKITGATHHCGHNLQLGVMMLVAQAFKKSGVASLLGGNISFIASPAEEYIELEYRSELRKRGDIRYFGGKQELVHCGAFDNIDAAMMVHSQSNTPYPFVGTVNTGNGLIAEMIRYVGKTAHAAAAPEDGINALHAAILGINAVNAIRETFHDEDHNRIHYIITKGGDAVNSVPADVRLECMVRSCNVVPLRLLLEKTEQAFRSGGYAMGALTEIKRLSGYLPLACNEELNRLFAENSRQFIPEKQVTNVDFFKASTDMGDVTHLTPAIHPMVGGTDGTLHAANFEAVDYTAAVITPAKIVASTLIDLLSNDAARMRSIIENNKPLLTKQKYLDLLDSFFS
jgi:amidohydrolase